MPKSKKLKKVLCSECEENYTTNKNGICDECESDSCASDYEYESGECWG